MGKNFKDKIGDRIFNKALKETTYSDKTEENSFDNIRALDVATSSLIRYSDKVFDQARYHFEKRQKEEHERQKSFYDRVRPKEKVYKYSDKLEKSKVIKPDKKLESINSKLKTAKGKEKVDLIKERENYVTKMNEKMQFERRYKKMRSNLAEAKYRIKKTAYDTKKKARSNMMSAVLILIAFLALGGIGASAFALSSTVVYQATLTSVVACCWGSIPTDIDKAEDYFYKKANAFKMEINDISDPDCDEVVRIGTVTYDHFDFISYLEAAHGGRFNYDPALEFEMEKLFNKMFTYYTLVTTKTKIVNELNPDTGEFEEVEKEVKVLEVHVKCLTFDEYAYTYLDDKQKEYYTATKSIHGGLQMFGAPYDGWQSSVNKYYEIDDNEFMITTLSNQNVYAIRDGTVVSKGDDYVEVECEKELSYKLSGIKDINLEVGESVTRGEVIAKSKYHIFVEISLEGTRLNPLFYMQKENEEEIVCEP